MSKISLAAAALLPIAAAFANVASAADFNFYGRSGDAIEVNLAALPGITAGSSFSALDTSGFTGHTVLTSDTLTAQSFATTGRLWVFADPLLATGDTNPSARGFQGTLAGSLLVNGQPKSFSVTVRPGFTGSGAGSVGQSGERINRPTNNPLFVAQQQQRLRYLHFGRYGTSFSPTGTFDAGTEEATRTFQAAFTGGYNTTQADVDGIIGPITAGWLNAANTATWDELIDPDPQPPGTFSTSTMIGNFDIYPAPDPRTGNRTGLTPQPERFATSWAVDLIFKGSAIAKVETGRTQRINALSMADGYGSFCCHNTHRAGMDIDLYTNSSTWNFGNGVRSAEEQIVINHASAFIRANATGRVIRIITSNDDIYDGIAALNPTTALYYDTSGGHQNHLHIDVGPPTQIAGLANLPGDFDLNDVVDASDYVVWRKHLGTMYTQSQFNTWRANFGRVRITPAGSASDAQTAPIPEPSTFGLLIAATSIMYFPRMRRR